MAYYTFFILVLSQSNGQSIIFRDLFSDSTTDMTTPKNSCVNVAIYFN